MLIKNLGQKGKTYIHNVYNQHNTQHCSDLSRGWDGSAANYRKQNQGNLIRI